jgi:hypothetical protein
MRTGKPKGRHPDTKSMGSVVKGRIGRAYKCQRDVAFDLAARINSRHGSSLAGLEFRPHVGERARGREDAENEGGQHIGRENTKARGSKGGHRRQAVIPPMNI